jgi:mannitol operon transcriptional antiterminator
VGVIVDCSKRVIGIIEVLINSREYVAVSEIADKLGISKRTVFREMDEVERVVHSIGMEIIKKTRLGVKLNATAEQINAFKAVSESCNDMGYNQETRQSQIISELLKSKEPKKFYHFSKMLDVSEATISYDMDKVEPWFAVRGIELVRKPGFGVYLEGTEKQLRKAIVDFLYQNYEHQDLLTLFSSGLTQGSMMDDVLDKGILVKVNGILASYKSPLSRKLTENAYMGLTIHLAIAVQRVLRGEEIHMKEETLSSLMRDAHFEIAREIGDSIEAVFDIRFPSDELGYITMHLKGSKLTTGSIVDQDELLISNFEITRIASNMIHGFKHLSGFNLLDDDQLLIGLVAHLRPAITRIKLNMEIRNPLLDKIKEMYPEIFAMSKDVSEIIEKKYEIELPPGEIGYIAMHFGASIERLRKQMGQQRRIKVGVVCASGIGTSSLLYSRLTKLFPEMELVIQLSRDDVSSGKPEAMGIELLVSTIYLEHTVIPNIRVNPLLMSDDVEHIKQTLSLVKSKMEPNPKVQQNVYVDETEHIKKLHMLTEAILGIESGFEIHELVKTANMKALIKNIADDSVMNTKAKRILFKELIDREKLGSTILHGEKTILIHTKSEAVSQPSFSIWRLEKPMTHPEGEEIDTAIVMLLGKHVPVVYLEIMSKLSKSLIEEPRFLEVLRIGTKVEVEKELKKILHQFLNRFLKRGDSHEL